MLKQTLVLFLVLLAGFSILPAGAQEHREEPLQQVITNRSYTPHTIDGDQFYLHAVLRGQTLYSIARAYGVDMDRIIEENPDITDGLRYDQVIRIPVTDDPDLVAKPLKIERREAAPEPEGEYIEHTVERRETLFGLSRQYDLSIEKILFYNPHAREGLQVGHVLKIPVAAGTESDDVFQLYTVAPGETKYGISRAFGLTIEELEALNPEIRDGLRAGHRLRIPLEGPDQTTTVAKPPVSRESFIFLPPDDKTFAPDPETDVYCFEPRTRDVYHVALLIPLYLENLPPETVPRQQVDTSVSRLAHPGLSAFVTGPAGDVRKELPPDHKSFSFISYYHGVLLALDSVRQHGGNIRLHVYDVCQDVTKAMKVTQQERFSEMDLVIGPFHRQSLNYISSYGRRHNIPVVSPLLADRDQLFGNPNLYKATPSLEAMLDEVASYVARHYPDQNIIVVHNDQPGARDIINAFQDTLLTSVAMAGHFYDSLHMQRVDGYFFEGTLVGNRRTNVLVMPEASSSKWLPDHMHGVENRRYLPKPRNVSEVIYRTDGFNGLISKFQRDRNNVLITLVGGEPFLAEYLRQLNEQRRFYHITVFGIPEWKDYTSIETDYLQNLRVHYFTPGFYDYTDTHIQDFVYRYRDMFLTEPDQDAFKGAQTAYFFFNALLEYGIEFDRCISLLNQQGHESPFSLKRSLGKNNGWENRHTTIYRIENYRKVDVQKPTEVLSIKTD